MQRIVNAQVVTEDEVLDRASVEVEADRIVSVGPPRGGARAGDVDLGGAYLVPGFLDIHTHAEVPDGTADYAEEVARYSDEMADLGVAGVLWTVANLPLARILETLEGLRDALDEAPETCRVLGVHSEGPYIAPTSRGAFEEGRVATPEQLPLSRLHEAGGRWLKYLSLSPDTAGAPELIRACVEQGLRVGIGHTLADAATVEAAIAAGAGAIVHTFNNTPDYPMKEPGVRGVTVDECGLASAEVYNELICDGIHVDPTLVRLVARAKGPDRVIVITDSTVGGGERPEGFTISREGATRTIRGGVGRNAQGNMAGSALTMPRAFRNYVRFTGAGLPEAVRATSLNAARFLGIDDAFGRIAPGSRARFAVLDADLELRMDLLAGG